MPLFFEGSPVVTLLTTTDKNTPILSVVVRHDRSLAAYKFLSLDSGRQDLSLREVLTDLVQPLSLTLGFFQMACDRVLESPGRSLLGHLGQCLHKLSFGIVDVFELIFEQLADGRQFHVAPQFWFGVGECTDRMVLAGLG